MSADRDRVSLPMTKSHKDALQTNHIRFLDDLEVASAVDHLFGKHILTPDMKDQIMAEKVTF